MKPQELLNEIEFEQNPGKASASLVVAVSNMEVQDHWNMFYPGFRI